MSLATPSVRSRNRRQQGASGEVTLSVPPLQKGGWDLRSTRLLYRRVTCLNTFDVAMLNSFLRRGLSPSRALSARHLRRGKRRCHQGLHCAKFLGCGPQALGSNHPPMLPPKKTCSVARFGVLEVWPSRLPRDQLRTLYIPSHPHSAILFILISAMYSMGNTPWSAKEIRRISGIALLTCEMPRSGTRPGGCAEVGDKVEAGMMNPDLLYI